MGVFSWLVGCEEASSSQEEVELRKVVFLGLDGAGKTSTVRRLNPSNHANHYLPNFGESVSIFDVFGLFTMACWDVGGDEWMRLNWKDYVVGASAVVYFIDAHEVKRLPEAVTELHNILRLPILRTLPLLIIANKCDFYSHLDEDKMRNLLKPIIKSHPSVNLFVCSARTGQGIQPAFTWLGKELIRQQDDFWLQKRR